MNKDILNSKKNVEHALLRTLSDPKRWGAALDVLISETGSTKGVILQRDTRTGQLMLPKNLPEYLSKPLLRGFTQQQMEEYENDYAENDPWTEIELRYPSIAPYALSTWMSIDELQQHDLYTWLAPQQITDTVVMDIYRDDDYWVAINLFFDHKDSLVRERCTGLLNEVQALMQAMWRALLTEYNQPGVSQPMTYFLNHRDKAELLINSVGKVFATSQRASDLLEDESFPLLIKSDRIFIRNQVIRERFWSLLRPAFDVNNDSVTFDFEGYWFKVMNVNTYVDLVGRDQGLKLVSINRGYSTDFLERPIWECDLLTKREKDLVRVLANGGRVVDFQKEYNLAKSTAHNYWTNVKKKLNITDRAQLVERKIEDIS